MSDFGHPRDGETGYGACILDTWDPSEKPESKLCYREAYVWQGQYEDAETRTRILPPQSNAVIGCAE
ncbi:hypothetical protein [Saccharospirillum salsuginis]|uniref:Uncharacterized protein n=1 Tax=Saccharospirillum salsuginis TaxID=418750 RepID=A0A918K8B7_9GAMM|nr:hypothetical protein [Saccharospirillum salsuginis]GGX54673.1 hypothetical protein GCM10007392_22640 [Saccharospirillum salsuginis]